MLKLTYQQVAEILWRLDHDETQADLAAKFGVSQGYISKLWNGQVKWFEDYKKRCDRPTAEKETG